MKKQHKATCLCGREVKLTKEQEKEFLEFVKAEGYKKGERIGMKRAGIGMGVSQWAQMGKDCKYWNYFVKEVRKDLAKELIAYIAERDDKGYDPASILTGLRAELFAEKFIKSK